MDALIPLKRLDQAKTRLSEHLPPAARVRLMQLLVTNAVEQVRAATAVDRTILVSSDPSSAELAAAWGIEHFDDRGLPWNDGLAAAMQEAVTSDSVVIVSADLPLLTAADVDAFVAQAPRPGVAIARARDAGTNGLVMTPSGRARTTFGVSGSAARHAELAADAGLPSAIVDLVPLAIDLDSLDDVRLVLEHDVAPELRAVLELAAAEHDA